MTSVAVLFIIVMFLYVAQCFLFIYGAARSRYRKNREYEPLVSIVTAARNEEHNIRACVESLIQIQYPKEKLEIIVVDDNSTDATSQIIHELAEKYSNVKVINAKQSIDRLRGKANAITQGIDISSGEIILMTDADCVVPHPGSARLFKISQTIRASSPA